MIKENTLYEIRITEESDSYVSAIALVDEPAIEKDFLAFEKYRKENTKLYFKLDSVERKELIGPAMVPDILIPRVTETGEWYDVTFSVEDIRNASQLYFKQNRSSNLNLNHNENEPAKDCFVYQSYIVDREKNIFPPIGMDELPNGTWIIGIKIDNDSIWEDVKNGKFKGFSVEGLFEMLEKVSGVEEALEHLSEDIETKEKVQDWAQEVSNYKMKEALKKEAYELRDKIIKGIVEGNF